MKLIATDLDGTFLGAESVVSPRTLAAVELANRAGVPVVAATGRGWRSASKVLESVSRIEHAVCSNGAMLFDRVGDRIVRIDPLDVAAVAEVVDLLHAKVPEVGLGWEFANGTFGWDDTFLAHHPGLAEHRGHERMPEVPLDDPPAEFLKVLVSAPTFTEGELYDHLQHLLPSNVEATASGIAFLEITGHGVTKAKALQALCDDLGVAAADVVAFGDNRNDVAMLQWAGRSYAMANGVDHAREAATHEAPDHREDGFAQIIESLFA